MIEVLDIAAERVNFLEEAKGCVQLAKAETHEAVRTVLLGMALGGLKLTDHTKSVGAIHLQPGDAHRMSG